MERKRMDWVLPNLLLYFIAEVETNTEDMETNTKRNTTTNENKANTTRTRRQKQTVHWN